MRLSKLLPLLGLLAIGYAKKCPRQRNSPGKEILCYTSSNNADELLEGICKCTTLVHQGHKLHDLSTAGVEELQKTLKDANPVLQVVISVTDPEGSLKTSATTRQEASGRLASVMSQVDGVELDMSAGSKERLTHFVKGLKDEMIRKSNEKRIILALPTRAEDLAKHYDLKSLSKYVDLFTLSTNYLVDKEESFKTFHPSRLMGIFDMLNTDSLVDLVSGMGVPKKKLLVSVPASAYKFTLKNDDKNMPGSSVKEEEPTVINQKELCNLMSAGEWTVERDSDLTAPYAFKDSTWIAFEDKTSVGIKGKYVLLRELAGLGIHDIENDSENDCGKTVVYEVYRSFTDMKRKTRGAVLASLENDLQHQNVPQSRNVRSSEFRIVRVVDTAGAIHAIRENTQTEFVCTRQGYFVHPKSCNRFYRCVKFNQGIDDYSVFEFDCPAGLAFDERTEVCVWPGSLTEGSPCPGSSEIAPVPRARFRCPARNGYFADPQNCRWFFACFDLGEPELTAYEFRCPFGLVFDEQKLICEWPWLVPSCGASGYSRPEYGGSGYEINFHGPGSGSVHDAIAGSLGFGDYSNGGVGGGSSGRYPGSADSSPYPGSKPSESRQTETEAGKYSGIGFNGAIYPGQQAGGNGAQYHGQGIHGSGYANSGNGGSGQFGTGAGGSTYSGSAGSGKFGAGTGGSTYSGNAGSGQLGAGSGGTTLSGSAGSGKFGAGYGGSTYSGDAGSGIFGAGFDGSSDAGSVGAGKFGAGSGGSSYSGSGKFGAGSDGSSYSGSGKFGAGSDGSTDSGSVGAGKFSAGSSGSTYSGFGKVGAGSDGSPNSGSGKFGAGSGGSSYTGSGKFGAGSDGSSYSGSGKFGAGSDGSTYPGSAGSGKFVAGYGGSTYSGDVDFGKFGAGSDGSTDSGFGKFGAGSGGSTYSGFGKFGAGSDGSTSSGSAGSGKFGAGSGGSTYSGSGHINSGAAGFGQLGAGFGGSTNAGSGYTDSGNAGFGQFGPGSGGLTHSGSGYAGSGNTGSGKFGAGSGASTNSGSSASGFNNFGSQTSQVPGSGHIGGGDSNSGAGLYGKGEAGSGGYSGSGHEDSSLSGFGVTNAGYPVGSSGSKYSKNGGNTANSDGNFGSKYHSSTGSGFAPSGYNSGNTGSTGAYNGLGNTGVVVETQGHDSPIYLTGTTGSGHSIGGGYSGSTGNTAGNIGFNAFGNTASNFDGSGATGQGIGKDGLTITLHKGGTQPHSDSKYSPGSGHYSGNRGNNGYGSGSTGSNFANRGNGASTTSNEGVSDSQDVVSNGYNSGFGVPTGTNGNVHFNQQNGAYGASNEGVSDSQDVINDKYNSGLGVFTGTTGNVYSGASGTKGGYDSATKNTFDNLNTAFDGFGIKSPGTASPGVLVQTATPGYSVTGSNYNTGIIGTGSLVIDHGSDHQTGFVSATPGSRVTFVNNGAEKNGANSYVNTGSSGTVSHPGTGGISTGTTTYHGNFGSSVYGDQSGKTGGFDGEGTRSGYAGSTGNVFGSKTNVGGFVAPGANHDEGYKTNEYENKGSRGTITFNNGYSSTKLTENDLRRPGTIISSEKSKGGDGATLGNKNAGIGQGFTKTGPTKTGFVTAQIGGTGSYVTAGPYNSQFTSTPGSNVFLGHIPADSSIGHDVNNLAYVTSTVSPDVSYVDTSKINLGHTSSGLSSGYQYKKPTTSFVTGSIAASTPSPLSVTDRDNNVPLTVTTPSSFLNVQVYNNPSVVTSAPITAAPAVVNTYSTVSRGYQYRRPTQKLGYPSSGNSVQQTTVYQKQYTVTPTSPPIAYVTGPADVYKSTLFEAAKQPVVVSSVAPVYDTGYKTVISSTSSPIADVTGQRFYSDSRFQTGNVGGTDQTPGRLDITYQQPEFNFQKEIVGSTPAKKLVYQNSGDSVQQTTVYRRPINTQKQYTVTPTSSPIGHVTGQAEVYKNTLFEAAKQPVSVSTVTPVYDTGYKTVISSTSSPVSDTTGKYFYSDSRFKTGSTSAADRTPGHLDVAYQPPAFNFQKEYPGSTPTQKSVYETSGVSGPQPTIYQRPSNGRKQYTVTPTPAPIAYVTDKAEVYKNTLFEAAKQPIGVSTATPVYDTGYKTVISSTSSPIADTTGEYFYSDSRFKTGTTGVKEQTSGHLDITYQQPEFNFHKEYVSSTLAPTTKGGYVYQKPTKQLNYDSPSTVTPSVTIHRRPSVTVQQPGKYVPASTPDYEGSYDKPFQTTRPVFDQQTTGQKGYGAKSTSSPGYVYSKPSVEFVTSTAAPIYTENGGYVYKNEGLSTKLTNTQQDGVASHNRGGIRYTPQVDYVDYNNGNSGFGNKEVGITVTSKTYEGTTPASVIKTNSYGSFTTSSPASTYIDGSGSTRLKGFYSSTKTYDATTPASVIRTNTYGPYTSSTPGSTYADGSGSSSYRPRVSYTTTPLYEVSTVKSTVAKGKGKIIVKLSDLHPLLLGKVGAQCTCRSDPFETLRGPGAKIIKTSRGDVDLKQYDESEIYVDLEADPETSRSAVAYGTPNGSPTLSPPVYSSSLKTPATAVFGLSSPAPAVFRSRGKPSTDYLPVSSSVSPIVEFYDGSSDADKIHVEKGDFQSPDTLDPQFVNLPAGFVREDLPIGRSAGVKTKTGKSLGSSAAGGNAIGGAGAAFDRYGPGGLRGVDETLQGGTDCARPGLFRHPKLCNKFYACHWDEWKQKYTLHVFNCPVHLSFDGSAGACNWPSDGPACQDDNLLV